ncbi:MAG: PAS domain S-box protein [Candidatus Abyssobacteria bacterium SURF_5]|uniref:histidine kinase n=1 Tax=Abyssobacteria bacterium (strain SURF_5) TaxID=2093360 RepID=A0A3A4MZ63_ABYX5|nr:MAG: PAS domain S-box protein [Candidatus Abyssubacteria bacterium SURF_5]
MLRKIAMKRLLKTRGMLLNENDRLRALAAEAEKLSAECRVANKNLREGEEKFRLVTETIQDVFWMITPDLGRMLYISPGYEKIWGRTRESLYREPRSFLDAVHPEDRAYMDEKIQDPNKDVEFRIIRPDGSIRWIRTRAFPILDEQGNLVKITGVATDITELTDKISQLQEAESLSAIGRTVAFVAHEVRNPLQIIQLGAETLQRELQHEARYRETLQEILHGVDVLNDTISQLLDYARPACLDMSPTTIEEIIEGALKNVSRRLDNIDVKTQVETGRERILADKEKCVQVLYNILLNAVEAMPDGGRISIRSRFISQNGARKAEISIADSGIGIREENLARLSEPFFTTKLGGIGLGLSICRKILQAHNGTLNITSKEHQGTTVEIVLPAQSENELPSEHPVA